MYLFYLYSCMDFACKITKNILQFSMLCPSSHNIIRVGPVACGPDQGIRMCGYAVVALLPDGL